MTTDISKIRFAWKVVMLYGNRWLSVVASGPKARNYNVKTWVHPKKGENPFLFVFRTREQARQWRDRWGSPKDYKIVRVEILNPRISAQTVGGKTIHVTQDFPIGTLFVDAVKVVRATYAFKVFYKSPRGNESAVAGCQSRVNYNLNKTTRPKAGQNQFLFVFENLADAKNFRNERLFTNSYAIYRCLVTGVCKSHKDTDGCWHRASAYPNGTLFCESVKPIELVVP